MQRAVLTLVLSLALCAVSACRLLQAAPPCETDDNCLPGDRCVVNRCVSETDAPLDGGAGSQDHNSNDVDAGGVDAGGVDAGGLDAGGGDSGPPDSVVPPGWAFGYPILVDTAGLTGDVENFPLPVTFTGDDVDFDAFSPDGADLRFEANGVLLPHVIDLFRVQGSVVWVRVPRLSPSEELTLWMFGGHPSPPPLPSQEMFTQVFAEDFVAVFPMTDYALAFGDIFAQHDGTYLVDGGIGRALACSDGAGFDLGRGIPWISGLARFTVSAFVHLNAPLASDFALFNVAVNAPSGATSGTSRIALEMNTNQQLRAIVRAPDTAGGARLESTAAVSEGTWHHVALAVDLPLDQVRVFLDGVDASIVDVNNGNALVQSYPFAADALDDTVSANGAICASDDLSGLFGDALVDEVRVASAYRSAAWLAAEARAVAPGLVTFGPREDAPP